MDIKKPDNYFKMLKFQLKEFIKSRRQRLGSRTYIFPVRFGFYYALGVALIAAVAYVYANNLVYLMAFFLVSMGVVVMHVTNRNVDAVEAEVYKPLEIFAEEKCDVEIELKTRKNKVSHFLHAEFNESYWKVFATKNKPVESCTAQALRLRRSLVLQNRGWQKIPALRLESTFPFGILRSWKMFKTPTAEILVFPARQGSSILPLRSLLKGQEAQGEFKQKSSENAFIGHRPYQNRDSFRQIDWRAYARANELLIKEFETEEKSFVVLDWQDTAHLANDELRLKQLSLWVDICEKSQKYYQLNMPAWQSEFGLGDIHRRACLEKLSLYPEQA